MIFQYIFIYSGYTGIGKSPDEDQPKAGLRGRKTFAFWTLVGLLLILGAGNLLLTVTILSVLHLGQGIMKSNKI